MPKNKSIILCDICKRYESLMIVETIVKGEVIAKEEMCESCFNDSQEEFEMMKDYNEYAQNR